MKNLWIALLVCAVAATAFFLGQRSRPVETAPVPAAAPAAQAAGTSDDADKSRLPSSQPVRTFRGPDGRAHMITYDSANPPDDKDPQVVRAGLLEDMRNHPRNITNSYDLSPGQIEAIVAGKAPIPDYMLPPPKGAKP